MIAKSGLCLHTDEIKDTENKSFLSQFKTRSFEGFAIQKIPVFCTLNFRRNLRK